MDSRNNSKKEEEEQVQVPVGYLFVPTDVELLTYLTKKLRGQKLPCNAVLERDIYGSEPWLLKGGNDIGGGGGGGEISTEYYFVPRDNNKSIAAGNGNRPNRIVKTRDGSSRGGFWKATGGDKPIRANDVFVGVKKSLKFFRYTSDLKTTKTDWLMNEYSLPPPKNVFQRLGIV